LRLSVFDPGKLADDSLSLVAKVASFVSAG
jgi:hypothetical protein